MIVSIFHYIWDNHKFLLIFILCIVSLIYNRYPVFKQISIIIKYCFIGILIIPEMILTIRDYINKLRRK